MTNDFFNLESIAVIGASRHPKKLGYQLLNNLVKAGFEGKIYPVNIEAPDKILGIKAYANVLDIHAKIDLAVIMVPREVVPIVLKQCVHKEVSYALIITAGFSEKDTAGKRLQKEIVEITQHQKTKIIGPNCLGIINTAAKINLTFAASNVKSGGIGMILQSGAIGAAILDWAKENNLGISKFISLGNEVQIDEIQSLELLGKDENTKMIALYVEQIKNPKEFLSVCRKVTIKKPVIVLKGGQTSEGVKAASSHTAALAAPEELIDAMFKQANVIVARGFEELVHFLELFSSKEITLNNTIGILSNAGGPAILAADAAANNNFKLPHLNLREKRVLKNKLNNFASLDNPIDLGGDARAKDYSKTIELMVNSGRFSSLLVIVTPQTMTEIDRTALAIAKYRKSKIPVIASFMGGYKMKSAIKILTQFRIPHYEDPLLAIELLAKISRYLEKNQESKVITGLGFSHVSELLSDEEMIRHYQIPFVRSHLVKNEAELMGAVEELDFPVAFKTAKNIAHKAKSGKVGLNINDQVALNRAVSVIGFPAIVQKMVDSPFEIIVGGKNDPVFGPVVIFGQGGILVEENSDIAFRMLPLTERDLNEMIEQTRIWPLLKNLKVKALVKEMILKVARILRENPSITAVEFNPIKVLSEKIIGVDINIKEKNE